MSLTQWFLTGGSASPGGGARPYAFCNMEMESFWTKKCSVQFTYLSQEGLK